MSVALGLAKRPTSRARLRSVRMQGRVDFIIMIEVDGKWNVHEQTAENNLYTLFVVSLHATLHLPRDT